MKLSADIIALGREANAADWDENFTEVDSRLTSGLTAAQNAVSVTWPAASEAAMLALAAKRGHECKRTDEKKVYRLQSADPTNLEDWVLIGQYAGITPEDIINTLTDDSTDKALSSNMGKELKQQLDGKLDISGMAANSDKLGGKTLVTVESERNSEIDTRIAAAVADLIAGAPSTYDTLQEIAAYIESDITGAAAMNTAIGLRELLSNKATSFTTVNDTLFPSVQAVVTKLAEYTTKLLPVSADKVNDYTLVSADNGKYIPFNKSGAVVCTLQNDTNAPDIAVGFQCVIQQKGAGQVSISLEAGITLDSEFGANKTRTAGSEVWIKKVAANRWAISGGITS